MGSVWHVPCVYLPLYYSFSTAVLGNGGPMDGLAAYRNDASKVLTTYWTTWPVIHACQFTAVPRELRIEFVSIAPFVWLIYLSFSSRQMLDDRGESGALTTPT